MHKAFVLGSFLVPFAAAACATDADPVDEAVSDIKGADDSFGEAIVIADFDGDGYDDAAVGVPFANSSYGEVRIYRGTKAGLVYTKTLTRLDAGGTNESTGGDFGWALAARDLDGDGKADLVVGCPRCVYDGIRGGAIFVYRGAQGSTLVSTNQIVTQAATNDSTPENQDLFGWSVAIGYFDGVHASVAVGVPGEKPGSGPVDAGWVNTFSYQNGVLVGGTGFDEAALAPIGANYNFGWAMTTLDLDGNGADSLVVLSPGNSALDVFSGASFTPRQRATHPGWGVSVHQSLGTGNYQGLSFASGAPLRELAASSIHASGSTVTEGVDIWRPEAGQLVLVQTVVDPHPSTSLVNEFGAAFAAADLNHDGTDELFVGCKTEGNGHLDVFKSTGGALVYWNDRGMVDPVTGSDEYGDAIGPGHFHGGHGDFDMLVGAPGANEVLQYLADGNGTIPSYQSTLED